MERETYSRKRLRDVSAGVGLGTRTPIRFGTALEKAVRHNMQDYRLFHQFTSPNYLLYAYTRPVGEKWLCFVLFQGARFQGRLTTEIGISRRPVYPYFPAVLLPFMAVDGTRDRIGNLMFQGEDKWWEYNSQDALNGILESITGEMLSRALYILMDSYAQKLESEISSWNRFYNEWLEEEEKAGVKPLGKRYSNLQDEEAIAEFVKTSLERRIYDRWMGFKIKQKLLDDPRRLNCMVYMTARLMQMDALERIISVEPRIPNYTDDEIVVLTGRAPDFNFFLDNQDPESRRNFYCFVKAVEIVEAFNPTHEE
ncbi:MAG: hypothetical protein J7M18_03560 [Candidatus Eremiobacteraeota bacterium]|nr:hypothetical protein [Candidatus Eremiobacteraeota bacterium]